MSERTEHGFRSGAIEVTALAEWSRRSVVGVRAGRTRFEITATPKGQTVELVMPERQESEINIVAPNGAGVRVYWSTRFGFVSARTPNREFIGSLQIEPPETV